MRVDATARVVALLTFLAGTARAQTPASAPAPASTTPAAKADDPLERAASEVRQGKLDEALGLIREASKTHPEWPTPRLILARMLLGADQAVLARRALELAAAEAPDDPSVYLTFATLALSEGRFSDTRLNAERALAALKVGKLADDRSRTVVAEANAALASVAEVRLDWPTAREHLLVWLESDPKNGPARQRLGRALFAVGKPDEAFRQLQQAAIDDPKLEPAGVSMGLLYGQKGDAAKAAEWFDYARKADPKSVAARLGYARWLLDRGRPDEAQPLADEAAAIAPGGKDVERLRGLLAWHRRDFAAAERAFEALHRDAPADVTIADLLARALIEQDDPAKKERALQLALANARQAPKSAEALATLGRAHYRLGHLDEAERLLRAATSGGQASADTAYFLARVLADRGRKDEARGILQKVTALPGTFAYCAEAKALLVSL
jgi:tetratricopeptide (TPR) repeat protein